ncbi:MAG TPA: serine hydrolase [Pirellulales bacterium]|jgi:beta-lactamase class A|nr:serine hydrolase [Pirellulales bacterium]
MHADFAGAADEPISLPGRLQPLIDAHRGHVAVAVQHLETGERFVYHEEEVFPTASLIKFPVLIELYRRAEEGGVDLETRLTLRAEDKVTGSGILTPHFSPGATFTLRDAARMMIAFSDNTATNLVLDKIGIAATGETMQKLGCPNTRLHHKVFLRETTSIDPERSERYGLGSTTAAEMLPLLGRLHRRELMSREASEAMLAHLKTCEDKQKFPRYLPDGMEVAFKTGSLDAVRTAAGILYTPGGPVALCVLTADNEDRRWTRDNAGDLLCAEIAREVNEAFKRP